MLKAKARSREGTPIQNQVKVIKGGKSKAQPSQKQQNPVQAKKEFKAILNSFKNNDNLSNERPKPSQVLLSNGQPPQFINKQLRVEESRVGRTFTPPSTAQEDLGQIMLSGGDNN